MAKKKGNVLIGNLVSEVFPIVWDEDHPLGMHDLCEALQDEILREYGVPHEESYIHAMSFAELVAGPDIR